MLRQAAETGQRDSGSGGDRKSLSKPTTVKLNDIGITRDESSRYQRLASIPESDIEDANAE
jgi:hypothetical protein